MKNDYVCSELIFNYVLPHLAQSLIVLKYFCLFNRILMICLPRRCVLEEAGGVQEPMVWCNRDYQLPYSEFVPADPSIEVMMEVVCFKGVRPHLPHAWMNYTVSACLYITTLSYICSWLYLLNLVTDTY